MKQSCRLKIEVSICAAAKCSEYLPSACRTASNIACAMACFEPLAFLLAKFLLFKRQQEKDNMTTDGMSPYLPKLQPRPARYAQHG